MMKHEFEIAIERTRKYCLRGEKCLQDVKNKLYKWKLPLEWHDKILSIIKNEGFVDEERFAFSFANDKCYLNKWGKIKIKYALLSKNIDENIVIKALDNIDNKKYKKIFSEIAEQKVKVLKEKEEKNHIIKQKLFAFLSQRGFEPDLFDEVNQHIENE